MFSLQNFWQKEKKNFPTPVIAVIGALVVENISWGLHEAFFSTIAEILLRDFFLVGVLVAVCQISLLVSLLFLSEILPRVSPFSVLIFGKIFNFFAFAFYFFGAFLISPPLFFVGAIVNGIGTAARESATRESLMKFSTKENASTIFGVNSGLRDFVWAIFLMSSGFLYTFLARFFDIHIEKILPFSFLIAAPFLILGITFLFFGKKDLSFIPEKNASHRFSVKHLFDFFKVFPKMLPATKFSMVMLFFLQMIQITTLIFLPLLAISLQLSPAEIGLLMGAVTAPMAFAVFFSIFEDRGDRLLFILGGLLFAAFPLFLLAQTNAPLWVGIFSVLISVSIAIIRPAALGLIASYIDHKDAPAVATLQVFFNRSGTALGSLGIGFVAQHFGISNAFFVIGSLAIFFAVIAVFIRFHFLEKIQKAHSFKIHPLHPRIFSHSHHHS